MNPESRLKEIVFKTAKKNHFYAKRNEKNQLELIENPTVGAKYYEIAVVAGGSY